MRFYFDIDDDYFCDEYGPEFKETIQEHAIESMVNEINGASFNYYQKEVFKLIDQIVKQKKDEIIETAVSRVADRIAKNKALAEFTPKASELAAMDKDNVAYFEKMIDKAIARRFGKQVD